MKYIFIKIILLFISLIVIIYITTDCNSKIYGKPIWSCPYNEERLKNLYIPESDGKYTSQSLFDIYSFTHISHGILLFYILRYIYKKKNEKMIYISIIYAIILEFIWEIIENLPITIERYRKTNKLARDYEGDSIINSIGDILSMIIGFIIAWYYPDYGYSLFIANELVLYYFIKDNLVMNIYQIFIK